MDFLHTIGMVDTYWPLPTILMRLVIALIFGAIIGLEREFSLHSAGLRTHILVALAAAVYTVLTLEIFHLPEVMSNGRSDPVHAVEAVTAGIAFLGAGVLFRGGGSRPHGLTTAAGMWLAGAAGMTAAPMIGKNGAIAWYTDGMSRSAMAGGTKVMLKSSM